MMRPQARLELVWKARPAAVAEARRAVTAFVERACPGMRDETREAIRLAVTEACANVVRHAYPPDPPGTLAVSAERTDDAVVVTVRDRGRGLRGGPSPGGGLGLGVHVICSAASAVAMSDPAGGGAEVRMHFGTA